MRWIACIEDYDEDGIEYWTKGRAYQAIKHRDENWSIKTNLGTMGKVGPGYLLDEFNEHFTTDPKLVQLAMTKI